MKTGFVSIVGKANVGKSTLLNSIIGEKVSIVSYHPQTTRDKINGILTTDEGQIVFIDTPGMHQPRNSLSQYMIKSINSALEEVDVIIYVIALDKKIQDDDLNKIRGYVSQNIPVIVVLNKGDVVSVEKIPASILKISEIEGIKAIIPVSARTGKNVKELVNEVFKYLKDGDMFYPEDMYTDKNIRFMVAELIREKTMQMLKDELPYGIAVEIDQYRVKENDVVEIYASIVCEKKAHKQIILGKSGEMIKHIGTAARYEIEKLTGQKVFLNLFVKVKEDWRKSDNLVKLLGYDEKEI